MVHTNFFRSIALAMQIYKKNKKNIHVKIKTQTQKITKRVKTFLIIRRISGPEDYRNDPWKILSYGWKISREV